MELKKKKLRKKVHSMHFFKFLGVYPVRAAQLWPLKLMENGGLHAEVQRQIRSHGLATGTIKRGVANII